MLMATLLYCLSHSIPFIDWSAPFSKLAAALCPVNLQISCALHRSRSFAVCLACSILISSQTGLVAKLRVCTSVPPTLAILPTNSNSKEVSLEFLDDKIKISNAYTPIPRFKTLSSLSSPCQMLQSTVQSTAGVFSGQGAPRSTPTRKSSAQSKLHCKIS
ncbi:hypothetical protein O181_025374 [Austropuccinia psidii MF-1]|uniref:Uncharacterized protein n=1 Tax=Austropuccinia psidii MF-1 TaxID=1389203 RepID=A0A9Q3CKF5_9BASI|nr:hypothetical protein [Austropuccinia psidii MF-1]